MTEQGDLCLVMEFLRKGVDINERRGKRKFFALAGAVDKNRLKVIRYLLRNGARLNTRTDCKWTPLYLACRRGHYKAARMLVEAGANVNTYTEAGWGGNRETPLEAAIEGSNYRMVRLLVDAGARVTRGIVVKAMNPPPWHQLHYRIIGCLLGKLGGFLKGI